MTVKHIRHSADERSTKINKFFVVSSIPFVRSLNLMKYLPYHDGQSNVCIY